MKNSSEFYFLSFVLMSLISVLASSCNKDKDDDKKPFGIITVQIPAGTFTMGSKSLASTISNKDYREHEVTLNAFQMSKYEITNSQFANFLNAKKVGVNGKYPTGATLIETLIFESSILVFWELPMIVTDWGLQYREDKWMPVPGFENHPVIYVTWYGANEFATYVGGRLPTEAEWEYACRANTTSRFNTGNCLTDAQANYDWSMPYTSEYTSCTNTNANYPGKTQPIGTYPANAFGLHDMHGNVWEWCSNWYGQYSYGPINNPPGPSTGTRRVIRSGTWRSNAFSCASAYRGYLKPHRYENNLGFRVAFN